MRALLPLAAAALLVAGAFPAVAQQEQPSLADQVLQGCAAELEAHCAQVTPGEGRLLACLYAHEDHLSGGCEFALYDAAARLERAVNALAFVAGECRSDIESLCASVQAGEGRILQCLEDHADEVSQPCTDALAEVGLRQ